MHANFPQNTTQICSFLGAANVHQRFAAGYAGIARTLNGIIRKDAEPDWHSPMKDQLEALETLKRKLVAPPILGLLKTNKPCMIHTDASAYELSASFLQEQEETKKEWNLIEYWSRTLTDTERKYSTTECKFYSVV